MTPSLRPTTLALVTDLALVPDWGELTNRVVAAVRGGVNLVQVRAKSLSHLEQEKLASMLVQVIGSSARVVVNGDPEIALSSGASGVHLPENSKIEISKARTILGPNTLIGRSVHSVKAAVQAEIDGADYVFFGTVFPSRSHPGGPTSGIAGITEATDAVSIPVVGIGGITAQNCKGVIDAGATGVAVIGAILGAYDSYRAARAIKSALAGGKSHAGRGAKGVAS